LDFSYCGPTKEMIDRRM